MDAANDNNVFLTDAPGYRHSEVRPLENVLNGAPRGEEIIQNLKARKSITLLTQLFGLTANELFAGVFLSQDQRQDILDRLRFHRLHFSNKAGPVHQGYMTYKAPDPHF